MSCKDNELSDKRILIVDDEEVILFLLQEELEEEGFISIDTALTGEECLKKLEKMHYDIVILDINMPYMNGVEVLRQIKMVMKMKVPVALHSAYPKYKADFEKDYNMLPPDGYIVKSANTEELFNFIFKSIVKS